MAIRQIDDYSIKAIANSIRRKLSTTEEFTLEKMPEKIDGIADYPRADDSTFGKIDDVPVEREPVYIVDSEDLNELGALAQKMAGKKALMSIEDMIYWLSRVQFIPQGYGESIQKIKNQISMGSGIVPFVHRGKAIDTNKIVANLSSAISQGLIPTTLTGSKFYYNNVLLPGFGEGTLEKYPYIWIRKNQTSGNYDLVLGTKPWYYETSMRCQGNSTIIHYTISIENVDTDIDWNFVKDNSGINFAIDDMRTVLWSNHDIPNGSATATDIYFRGSEPVPFE